MSNFDLKQMLFKYSEMLNVVQKTLKEYPSMREMWLSDISNEFIHEYNSCEFVKLYPNDDDQIVEIARQAAENFLSKLLQEERKRDNVLLHTDRVSGK